LFGFFFSIWLIGQASATATMVAGTGVAVGGSGAGIAKPTGTSHAITPFEGAASTSGVAAKGLAVAVGVIGMMMI
jgi:hypothetical protein